MNTNQPRNEILADVTLFWVKLSKPVPNYQGDADQWELQVRVPKKRKAELEAYGKVKEESDGTFSKNFQKKSIKADGSPAMPVSVVDKFKQPVDPKTIGNGSKGNVMVMLRDYKILHPKTGKVYKEGVSVMLNKVQITELVKYEPKGGNFTDFDYEETAEGQAPKKQALAEDADF